MQRMGGKERGVREERKDGKEGRWKDGRKGIKEEGGREEEGREKRFIFVSFQYKNSANTN
jgi:hypothetical protein